MQKINILPNEIKNNLKYNYIIVSLKNIFGIFIISFSFASMALLVGNLILDVNLGKLTLLSSDLSRGSYNTIGKKIKSINTKIESVSFIKNDLIDWNPIIEDLINNDDKKIQINNLSINKSTKKFSLSGNAEEREALIKFKETLEKNKTYNEVSLPLDSLLEKYNINFSISGNLIL